jgi:hypothetical protein
VRDGQRDQAVVVWSRGTRTLIRNLLAASIAVLVLLSTLCEVARLGFGYDTLFGVARLFSLGQEANVPTWFSSAMLIIAGLLAAAVAVNKYQAGDQLARHWVLLSIVLCLMSLDETAVMHEVFSSRAAQVVFGVRGAPWFVYYAWIVPGIVVLGLMLVSFATLWKSLGPQTRPQFTRAAVIFFGGALGVEVAEAAFAAAFGLEHATASPVYTAIWTMQELLEMAGVAALLLALLDYIALNHICLALSIEAARPGETQAPVQRTLAAHRVARD